jgi:hypothetical protein
MSINHKNFKKRKKIKKMFLSLTLPSYSFFDKTSGAIYAGVPTVDLGWECNTDD